jgi:hypothetical protein
MTKKSQGIRLLIGNLFRVGSHKVSNNPGKFLALLLLQKVSGAFNGYVILALRSIECAKWLE